MNVRYRVELSQGERQELKALVSGGKHAARKLKRAQIQLAADAGVGDEEVARSVGVGGSIVYRPKWRFVEGNLEAALSEEPRPGVSRKLSGKEEALLVATACSKPPAGWARWTLELLAGRVRQADRARRAVARDGTPPPGGERSQALAPRHVMHPRGRRHLRPPHGGRARSICRGLDPKRPVVCFDESPTQLIGEVRQTIPATPGQLERYDCEYRRNGTANVFVFLDAHRPWRTVRVTDRRTARDFAELHARPLRSALSRGRADPRRPR
jgi:transposase